jgi:hypothetical protein
MKPVLSLAAASFLLMASGAPECSRLGRLSRRLWWCGLRGPMAQPLSAVPVAPPPIAKARRAARLYHGAYGGYGYHGAITAATGAVVTRDAAMAPPPSPVRRSALRPPRQPIRRPAPTTIRRPTTNPIRTSSPRSAAG